MGIRLVRALAGPMPVLGMMLRVDAHVVVLVVSSWLVGKLGLGFLPAGY